jgi:hypothetical protein
MKGLYLIWPDHTYIDRAIEAGIDTLLVTFYNLPGELNDGSYFDTFEQSKAVFERYKNSGVRLIAVPAIYQFWSDLPESERFFQGGKSYSRGFCPTSVDHIEKMMAPFRDLVNQGLCHEVIWDTEHYSVVPQIYAQEIECDCFRCMNINHEDQWKRRADIMKKETWSTGQMCYNSWWSMGCYNNSSKFLTESTYDLGGKKFGRRFDLWKQKREAKKHGVSYHITPGVFLEVFSSTDTFFEYIKWLKSHCPYDGGYWIYTQKAMSRWSKMTEDGGIKKLEQDYGYYERRLIDIVDPNFFAKLKDING